MGVLSSRPYKLPGTTTITDHEFGEIKVTRVRTHYLRLKVEPDGQVSASIPYYATLKSLQTLVSKNRASLRKTIAKLPKFHEYTDEQIKQIRKKAKGFLPARVEYLAHKHGFKYGKLSFRNQKTRWGSCSSSNNLSLNIALVLLPANLIDYIILHELTHTTEKNHSIAFWAKLSEIYPDYKKARKALRGHTPRLN